MVSETKKRINAKWDKANSKSFSIKCMLKSDKDILDFLETLDNRNAFIKDLIRSYIKSQETTKGE